MDELGPLFEQKYGVKVTYNYAGSGHLLNQLELAQQGDVYQPGSTYYFDIAREKSLIDYEKRVAYHVPVIAIPKGNPANITYLNDLTKPGVKVALGDPKACAIGKLGDKILEKNGIKDAVGDNVILSLCIQRGRGCSNNMGRNGAFCARCDRYYRDTGRGKHHKDNSDRNINVFGKQRICKEVR